MIFDKKNNPILQEWKKRYSEQPLEVQQALDKLKDKQKITYELVPIKRSRKEIKKGDIFVVQPRKDVYFYGKVLNANIEHIKNNHMNNGAQTIIIFNQKVDEIKLPDKPLDYENLLIAPKIVDTKCWTMGYFDTVGNIELTDEEQNIDYGFYDIAFGKFLKENGEEINHRPQILGTYGKGSYGSVAYEMTKEFIINPSLLEIDNI